jgi:hypothetical protein
MNVSPSQPSTQTPLSRPIYRRWLAWGSRVECFTLPALCSVLHAPGSMRAVPAIRLSSHRDNIGALRS